jgi:dolichol-phosphate mannosyltransferase
VSNRHLSIIAPAHNEEQNIPPLVEQVHAVLSPLGHRFELILVDDGSTDRTQEVIRSLMPGRPWLRCITMTDTPAGRGHGQSAAFHAGFRAAKGDLLVLLDADLQNDPTDIPAMLALLESTRADMVQGDRSHCRQDHIVRKVSSVVGRLFRRWLVDDTIRDTGCSLRILRREVALGLPLEFRGMHRFIPATARHLGYRVVEMSVTHRARVAGQTKYGMGVFSRAVPGFVDCLAVRYMKNRRRPVTSREIEPPESPYSHP